MRGLTKSLPPAAHLRSIFHRCFSTSPPPQAHHRQCLPPPYFLSRPHRNPPFSPSTYKHFSSNSGNNGAPQDNTALAISAELLKDQEAETKAKNMEEETSRLQRSLEEKNCQLQAFASNAEKYLDDLDNLKSQLSVTKATADASAASAQSAQLQCVALVKDLDEKNGSLKDHEARVNLLAQQLNLLQKDLQARESSQKQLKDEVLRFEDDIMQALAKAGATNDCELGRILDEVSPKNFEKINILLDAKDDEIEKLRDEIRIMSAHWKLKTKELESQLKKRQRADQELKKRVLTLEFCLHEARSQTRKLQRMGERRDKAIKELKDRLATKQQEGATGGEIHNFWESSNFKIVASMSMVILVLFSKR